MGDVAAKRLVTPLKQLGEYKMKFQDMYSLAIKIENKTKEEEEIINNALMCWKSGAYESAKNWLGKIKNINLVQNIKS